tara:strand:- start:180 stop:311 length:132 start_codon:yes stop_codon:yes gene_type:complete
MVMGLLHPGFFNSWPVNQKQNNATNNSQKGKNNRIYSMLNESG